MPTFTKTSQENSEDVESSSDTADEASIAPKINNSAFQRFKAALDVTTFLEMLFKNWLFMRSMIYNIQNKILFGRYRDEWMVLFVVFIISTCTVAVTLVLAFQLCDCFDVNKSLLKRISDLQNEKMNFLKTLQNMTDEDNEYDSGEVM